MGPGGSGVRAAKLPDRVTVAAQPPTFQLFPSLVTSLIYIPGPSFGGESSECYSLLQ